MHWLMMCIITTTIAAAAAVVIVMNINICTSPAVHQPSQHLSIVQRQPGYYIVHSGFCMMYCCLFVCWYCPLRIMAMLCHLAVPDMTWGNPAPVTSDSHMHQTHQASHSLEHLSNQKAGQPTSNCMSVCRPISSLIHELLPELSCIDVSAGQPLCKYAGIVMFHTLYRGLLHWQNQEAAMLSLCWPCHIA